MMTVLPLKLTNNRHGRIRKYTVQYPIKTIGSKRKNGKFKTSSIQVKYLGIVVKRILYNVGDVESERQAIEKAIAYCVGAIEAKKYFEQQTVKDVWDK